VTEARLAEERVRWGIREGDIVIGFMGRLVANKGPQDVVTAVEEVHRTHPHIKLLVVGTGSGQEGNVEGDLRRVIQQRDLGGFVIMTGHQPEEPVFYRLFDVFVLSTRTPEPFATTVVQAMMAGKPVVATATGGSPEIVLHGETGLLVPPANPTALADALRRLLDDPELARRVARAGREHVLEFNREEVTTREVEGIYEEVLCER
jgi:glycosyltransferase involved in cell wall biosynthesis